MYILYSSFMSEYCLEDKLHTPVSFSVGLLEVYCLHLSELTEQVIPEHFQIYSNI